MLKWVIVLLIAVGAFYAVRNWPSLGARWNDELSQASSVLQTKGAATPSPPSVESWGVRNVGSLRVELPFSLKPFTPPAGKTPPPNVRLEFFSGRTGNRGVVIGHGTNTTMAGGLAISVFSDAMEQAAGASGLEIISTNPATSLLHGFRVRRSDYLSRTSPRFRVRCVLLERGSEAWFLQALAPEDDAGGEGFFQRMANSAQ